MITIGKWRWPLIVAFSLVVGGGLYALDIVRPVYEAQAMLSYSGDIQEMDQDLNRFRSSAAKEMTLEEIPGQPAAISLRAQAGRSAEVVEKLQAAAAGCVQQSLAAHRQALESLRDGLRKQAAAMEAQEILLSGSRQTLLATYRRKPIPTTAARIAELHHQINEAHFRWDYFSRLMKEADVQLQTLKPVWKAIRPSQAPVWPHDVQGWPIGAGSMAGAFILGILVFRPKHSKEKEVASPVSKVEEKIPEAPQPVSEVPVSLEVISPELPSDPLTPKAADLYAKWVELARILYTPAAQAPQGVLDQVAPLLQESSEFLVQGHDVLARYLAQVVTEGDLPAHVARTVLMTLTGAEEARVSPEHRLAMALAALFHDLAVVARPTAAQVEAGSEVGRLSASVLTRIPGLTPALLSMVEDILVGMDEYKLDTWQNVANGLTLEPLSKVLREIDRFEKIMQKQRARLDRRRTGPPDELGEPLPQHSNG